MVRLLVQIGTSLKKAHAVLETMARGFSATIEAESNDMDALTKGLSALGVEAQPLRIPEVAVRDVRARLGLSQADFALRFGFEKDTIQNWEQGRSRLDAVSRMLLAIHRAIAGGRRRRAIFSAVRRDSVCTSSLDQ